MMNITEETEPAPDVIARIESGLTEYNLSRVGYEDLRSMWLIARDETGAVQGGLRGMTFFNWCFVWWLWVDEKHRGQGIGADLLQRAEAVARQRQCIGIFLDTFTFQAPAFYEKQGYQEFGRIDDIPKGQSRIWMKKTLERVARTRLSR